MRCPKCDSNDDKVLDSRAAREDKAIRRRRQCLACDHRFTTYEEIVRDELKVVKRDGRLEPFDRIKLERGLMRACEKRPVTSDQIHDLLDQIIKSFGDRTEITVDEIGEAALKKLHAIDEVAYIRFASVYRRFGDVSEFVQAIKDIAQS
ncbi:MAG: transcriptional regulator NrdR [Kiritimatiellae bacterium]|nr:transcriptional regulator NrdR [Kiritimatiellia bacterium]